MKKFGFMLMAALVAVMSFSSCDKKGGNDPIIGPTGGDEVKLPSVESTADAVTVVIKFDVAPCEGYDILFVGKYGDQVDGAGEPASWNFATAKKMVAIGDGWYKIVLKPGEVDAESGVCISGRPIQGKNGEGEWDKDWSHSGDDLIMHKGNESSIADSGYGEINLNFTEADAADGVVVFLESKKWNLMPCADASDYTVTVLVPEFPEGKELPIELIGGFNGWADEGTVALTKVEGNKYTANVKAMNGQEWKVRGQGTWDIEIEVIDDDPESENYDNWGGVPNNKFGAELNVTVDYSDGAKYRWKVPAE